MHAIINFSLRNKALILLMSLGILVGGIYSINHISIGAVPDITTNQVQVITTSRNLSTEEVERYLTYPVELGMRNLPGVTDIRSISKFGLSVVTVVFEDYIGAYLPRQLIAEQLKIIENEIPSEFGQPFMGPITTGLGEIYQYILDVEPNYADQYDVTDLRGIQDWVVKRQLGGIPGVIEVNTWGGYLKTYEVAINPDKLRALNLSINQVYDALQNNNAVTGGGYIEKNQEAFFIRAEGLIQNLSELDQITIATINGTSIKVKDIGKAQFGAATRFGAITANGEGEKVLGQVMMLKGANSKDVINAVRARVDEIQLNLPKGVYIKPILDRADLIEKTTFTVAENLILGFLIVLFVVVFLLGSWRSGLVVASVIPLTLSIALIAMYYFNIDANLMSLGAIDFGIIIDGAVIIVEYIAYILTKQSHEWYATPIHERSKLTTSIAAKGANKMMHSAVFGQLIIIIVFIPILTLTGVEGKMFIPMALTFCFAVLGAMFLCFTYVPVMSALFIRPSLNTESSWSARFIISLQRLYEPILTMVLNAKKVVIGISVLLFMISIWLLSTMGSEFVPTLDEGDFVIQPVLKTGMSLKATVAMTTRIESIVKKFPEVKEVVTRIGAAEVPTDPMSMEESDVIITLKPKSAWTSASSKDELADLIKKSILDDIPGIEVEFTQPIEMRFNELISGAKSDIAIVLYGEDIDLLYSKASEVETLVKNIKGAADVSVEKIDGLPQLSVMYDMDKLAQYGVSVSDLNDIVSMGFAGKSAGTFFEGERKYDITLRYASAYRNDIDKLKNAVVSLANGTQLPLSNFATISQKAGPAKISRNNTKRRVVIGINVRGSDLATVVKEAQTLIKNNIDVPTGYHFEYGGQFENLERAKARLQIAVPIALLLIFMLLYFAFDSAKEALLIYSAIPLSAIGGILALYARGLPFSISAGVGFIALFGIAVLNGIVMIEHFKELKKEGMNHDNNLIIKGALDRLRPVLLTAIAAALGFLPMAISTSAGAEVQRPLATVVIGGLISATLLTLLVLPSLYSLFGKSKRYKSTLSVLLILVLSMLGLPNSNAQAILTLEAALAKAKAFHPSTQLSDISIDQAKAFLTNPNAKPNTDIFYGYDRNNIARNDKAIHVFGLSQSFKLPKYYESAKNNQRMEVVTEEKKGKYTSNLLEQAVALAYENAAFNSKKSDVYTQIDAIYNDYLTTTNKKLKAGETNAIEQMVVGQKRALLRISMLEAQTTTAEAMNELALLIGKSEEAITLPYNRMTQGIEENNNYPILTLQTALMAQLQAKNDQIKGEALPEINLSLFNGMNSFANPVLYPGVQVGVSLPLSQGYTKARLKSNDLERAKLTIEQNYTRLFLDTKKQSLTSLLRQSEEKLTYFQNEVLNINQTLLTKAKLALTNGELDYLNYLNILSQTSESELRYIDLIHQYNQNLINLQYLTK